MKKTITEITEKFGTDGKIIERVTKTTIEETNYTLTYPYSYPFTTMTSGGTGVTSTTSTTGYVTTSNFGDK